MKYSRFSKKQLLSMLWWSVPKYADKDALIADGSVRSGKTLSMTVGFLTWACTCYDGMSFAICGKTIESLRRNVILHLREWLPAEYDITEKRMENVVVVSYGGRTNRFHMFGGRDESSYMLIQGMTLAGVLFDEVALQPRSFVEQAMARCSVDGSKFWFNCNPEGPEHWFYKEWVQRCDEKNALHLHFTMDDNLSLSDKIRQRYEGMFSGVFYDRYVRGLWVLAEGLIYPSAPSGAYTADPPETFDRYFVSLDYGVQNAFAALLFGRGTDGTWYVVDEYYHSGRATNEQKTNGEYYEAVERLIGGRAVECIIVDPSATSFIAEIRSRHKYKARKAKNDVLSGIEHTTTALTEGYVKVCPACTNTLREFGLYVWDDKNHGGKDVPVKENDHTMDALRYGVETMELYEQKPDYVPLMQRRGLRPLGGRGVF